MNDMKSEGNEIPEKLYFRIGDVAELLSVKPYVLRYWESEFSIITPEKSSTGQRVYRRNDVETLMLIKHLLYTERFSIEGARRKIRDLRKDGQFKAYKHEALFGATDEGLRKSRTNRISELLREVEPLVRESTDVVFKY